MAARHKILIVEDDLDLAEMLTAYFRIQGYEVLTAAWGEDALRATRDGLPDIVLLDIRLPDIDGFEVCRQLRRNRRTGNLPVIFLTEKRERADRLEGLELGAVDYITKPFDVHELRLRVHNALERASLASLVNAVTGLPEGTVVDERLAALLEARGWALLVVTIRGLDAFREAYGFLASDDVLRAAALLLADAVRDQGAPGDFLGHLAAEDFAIVTGEARAPAMAERIRSRFGQAIEYFYPEQDRAASQQDSGLQVVIGALTDSALPADLNGLKTAALRSRTA